MHTSRTQQALSPQLIGCSWLHATGPQMRCLRRPQATRRHVVGALTYRTHAPESAVVERRVMHVSGAASEVLVIPANKGPARLQVLVIPGNPGSARYYEEQLQSLHAALGGQAEVFAITHVGHDPLLTSEPGTALWSIQDQIRHKADLIQSCLQPGKPPLAVVGHSIGAYMACHAVAQAEAQLAAAGKASPRVAKVFALFPFFSLDHGSTEIKIHKILAAGYEVMGRVAWLISSLPASPKRAVVRFFSGGGMDQGAEELTQDLLTFSSVRNNFYMAFTEYKALDVPPPYDMLCELGPRLHVFGCPEDFWFPRAKYDELVEQVPTLKGATWVEDVGHAYCTSKQQIERMTGLIVEGLSDVLQSRPSGDSQLVQPGAASR